MKTAKRILLFTVLMLGLVIMTGCSKSETAETNTEGSKLTAEEIVNEMKKQNTNIGKIVVYNEETDLNKLLGRPNQYISKITFEDIRLEQVNTDNEFLTEEEQDEPTGGTIEVFENSKDMQKRKDYIETVTSGMPGLTQYMYSKGNVLMRLESDLTPTQAKEYEEIFNSIVK